MCWVVSRYRNIRQSHSDDCLYLLTDPQQDALDQSLSELNLFDPRTSPLGNGEAVWKFVEDIQKDPYNTAMTAFSKLTDKLIYR